jgi:cysteine desulfurase/selenocysteine lyase
MNWDLIRNEYLNHYNGIYLNSPANGLLSSANVAFTQTETAKFLKDPGRYRMDFIFKQVPLVKEQISNLINAEADNIALIQNFSIGINFFISTLPPESRVVLFEGDFPSLNMPFEERNFEIKWFRFLEDHTLDLGNLEQLLRSENPDILAISHCQWQTGYLVDIEGIGKLCKQYQCTFIVDCTQSFGAISMDVKKCNIDVLGSSCYKWPLAGFGNGFMYLSPRVLEKYPPQIAGFNSNTWDAGNPIYIAGAKSFEPGHHDHDAFNRLYFALKRINEIGIEAIHLRICELMDELIDQLKKHDIPIVGDFYQENRLGILSIPRRPGLFKHLMQHGIETTERGDYIRLGLHYYNNKSDIDALVSAILSYKEAV